MRRSAGIFGLAVLVIAAATGAQASSEEAWDEMRAAVRNQCLQLAKAQSLGQVDVEVDPFGSESYGLALLVTGRKGQTAKAGGDQGRAFLCVMDKRSGKAELGTELPLRR
ncbi:hypothetical protein [Chelatococcus sp. GCM10030263]|uniref:hypothetical protein n=1 Tax=Chelatococcus sp. GCM10030263 TaxID=3273387 RepID=UPI00367164D1